MKVIASLRESLATKGCPPDALFRAIADCAKTLTGAEGVALALYADGVVTCRARSGNLAPQIGDRVNGSGISGECLRTSRALRCDDTQTDDRVDPEVCRNVGIRSIAVVPLRGHDETLGILEAFSGHSYAFGAEQVSLLKRLAEIAQGAYEAEYGPRVLPPETEVDSAGQARVDAAVFGSASAVSLPSKPIRAVATKRLRAELIFRRGPSRRRYWIAAIVALVLLTAAVIWTTWQEPDEDGSTLQPTAQPVNVSDEADARTTLAVIPWKPPAGLRRVQPALGNRSGQIQSKQTEPVLQNAAEIENDRALMRQDAGGGGATKTVVEEDPPASLEKATDPPSPVGSMPVTPSLSGNQALGDLATTAPTLPASNLRVSQGVSEAQLVRKVQPVYPAEARTQRLEGSVVLDVTIADDGSTQDLKVVSGPPMLVRAATDAVRQWRYHPALLNGKPVAVQKQITVIFRAP